MVSLYRFNDRTVQQAVNELRSLLIVSGPSLADRLLDLGIAATCVPEEFDYSALEEELEAREQVLFPVLCPPRSKAGLDRALEIARLGYQFSGSKWLYANPEDQEWLNPDLGTGYDLGDWIDELEAEGLDLECEISNRIRGAIEPKARDFSQKPPSRPQPKQSTQAVKKPQNQRTTSLFAQKIEREFVQGSAIDPELFEAAIHLVSDTEILPGGDVAYPIHEALGWNFSRFGHQAQENFEAALFLNEDGSCWQSKFDKSLDPDKKPYIAPKGNGSKAFMPPIPASIRQEIGYRHGVNVPLDGSFWSWLEQHPEIPIIPTEGGKKALALLSQGYVAIALYGVNGGVLVNDRIGGEKIRKLKPELILDLQRFAVPNRVFVLSFDQDSKPETRGKVGAALGQLGGLLTKAGSGVRVAEWQPEQGKGVDDLIVKCGAETWQKSYSEAVSFAQWSIAHQLSREVRRKPDLNIGDREFIEVVAELPTEGIVALHGGKATSKSKAIGALLKDRSWLSVTHLSSLARDQAAGWGGVFVNDGDRHGSKLLKDGVPVNGGSCCIPSMLKVSAADAEVLVLDELTASLEFSLGSKLANKDGIRPLLLAEYDRRIREARLVLVADADLMEEALQHVEAVRGERAYLVRSERQALPYEATVIDGSKNEAITLLHKRIEQAPKDKLFYITSDSKTLAETLTELLGAARTLLITSNTSSDTLQASLLSSKGRDLPGLVLMGIRYIVSSPSVCQGFSFEYHTDLIDSVWCFDQGGSISAHSIAQSPDRIRDKNIPRFFWVANKGSAYSRLGKAQSVEPFLKEFKQLNTTAARLVAQSLTPEAAFTVDRLDWQNRNLRMLAALEVRRNRGMFALKETVIALLRKEGKRVTVAKPAVLQEEVQAVSEALALADDIVENRHREAVATAPKITKVEADAFSQQSDPLTPEQALSLEQFYLSEFYRLEAVSPQDVAFDRKGRTRSEIKALEAVLSPSLATEATAWSINQNPNNPQDWNPIAVRNWLLEQSGAAALIRQIADGEVETLTSDLVAPIAAFIRSHPTEFRIAFNFRSIVERSDQQIIGEVLTRHGIRTKRCGNKNNHRYEVQKEALELLLGIINRRKPGITPPLEQEINQRGVIPPNSSDWLSPECLEDIRQWWQTAESEEVREDLRGWVPPDVLRRAIA